MEADEMEMSKAELQRLIRDRVQETLQSSSALNKKYSLLRSLLDRKQRQIYKLSTICQSVAECEKTVKELYSLLGWEYKDEDSDEGDAELADCRRTLPFLFAPSERRIHTPPPSEPPSPQPSESEDEEILERHDNHERPVVLMKEAVVVLTELSRSEIIAAVRPPAPQLDSSEDETLSRSESDMQWEPEDTSSDSEFSMSDFNIRPNKKRRLCHNYENCKKTNQPSRRCRNVAKISGSKTSTPSAGTTTTTTTRSSTQNNRKETSTVKATLDAAAQRNSTEATGLQANTTKTTIQTNTTKTTPHSLANTTNPTPRSSTKTSPGSSAVKTSTPSADIKGVTPVSHQSQTSGSAPPKVLQVDITVDMTVLAKRWSLSWQPGKITEIITKDGKVKYKVVLKEKGKCLVSSHHIALDRPPALENLFVGARVVVKYKSDQPDFKPGILAEVPSRKNRMRFLVFIDDHTPVYCGLPLLRLVCKPLADPLDDIPDENHRVYMREYLMAWPYPLVTQYKVGQMLNADYNGVQQKCEVLEVDNSLIYVVFMCDQHKEWLYRGSMRLEHMVNMRQNMMAKKNDKKNNGPS